MAHSNKIVIQAIAEILLAFEITDIVLSPGSRNAPFIIEFTEDNRFICHSVVDERSAAFVACGMSKAFKKAVVICCTSGSALANYYPAITEAFYQNIPIIILSADRPEYFIDIFDGQTIRQKNIFEPHAVFNTQLLLSETDEAITENFISIKNAISHCVLRKAPVHINVPLEEPLYELTEEKLFSINEIKIPKKEFSPPDYKNISEIWNNSLKKLILCGSLDKNEELNILLNQFRKDESVIILCESTSNLSNPEFISSIDSIVFNFDDEFIRQYHPDLLLTIGQNVVSKKIKDFLRKADISYHFHLDEYWQPDTYNHLTHKILYPKNEFLSVLLSLSKLQNSNFKKIWIEKRNENEIIIKEYLKKIEFSDLKVFEILSKNIPQNTILHFSNSSPIRYSQLFDFNNKKKVYCNRGVSGIDGCSSTAIGFALKSDKINILITGDISFFYDINALWNNEIPSNFKIILINNGGGNIFKIIPGPENTNALEKYLETKHNRNAKLIAEIFGFNYFLAKDEIQLKQRLNDIFSNNNTPQLLEINTKECNNSNILKNYFKILKK